MRHFNAGQLLAVTSGAYSDYSFNGVYKVLKNFETLKVGQTFLDQLPKGTSSWSAIERLIPFLTKEGYIEELAVEEVNVGYSCLDPMWGHQKDLTDV